MSDDDDDFFDMAPLHFGAPAKSYPRRVVIDDRCNVCGPEAKGRFGIVFRFQQDQDAPEFPVICVKCVDEAHAAAHARAPFPGEAPKIGAQ